MPGIGDVIIRLATDDDLNRIFEIWLQGTGDVFTGDDLKNAKRKFESNFYCRNGIFNFWVAEDKSGVIQGWQSLLPCSNNPLRHNKMAESSTYLSEEFKFKGIGKLLLHTAISEAEKSDLEYIIGYVSENNSASLKLTQEAGWNRLGLLPASQKTKGSPNKFIMVKVVKPF